MDMISFTEKILGKMLIDIGGIRFVDSNAGTEKEGGPESPTERINCRVTPKVPMICVEICVNIISFAHTNNFSARSPHSHRDQRLRKAHTSTTMMKRFPHLMAYPLETGSRLKVR